MRAPVLRGRPPSAARQALALFRRRSPRAVPRAACAARVGGQHDARPVASRRVRINLLSSAATCPNSVTGAFATSPSSLLRNRISRSTIAWSSTVHNCDTGDDHTSRHALRSAAVSPVGGLGGVGEASERGCDWGGRGAECLRSAGGGAGHAAILEWRTRPARAKTVRRTHSARPSASLLVAGEGSSGTGRSRYGRGRGEEGTVLRGGALSRSECATRQGDLSRELGPLSGGADRRPRPGGSHPSATRAALSYANSGRRWSFRNTPSGSSSRRSAMKSAARGYRSSSCSRVR